MRKGVLYFLTYEEKAPCKKPLTVINTYYQWCIRSAKGIRKYMPDLEIVLYTNLRKELIREKYFDNVIYSLGEVEDLWTYKYECILDSPYDITLHLDADTLICDEFTELFDLMDRFDLALPLNPWYLLDKPKGLPMSFPTFAGGCMVWKKNKRMRQFFERVKELVIKRTKRADEPWIRKALYESDVRYTILPWEYSCCYLLPGVMNGKAKILQGKGDYIEEDAILLNSEREDPRCLFTGETIIEFEKVKGRTIKIGKMIPYGYNPNRIS